MKGTLIDHMVLAAMNHFPINTTTGKDTSGPAGVDWLEVIALTSHMKVETVRTSYSEPFQMNL